MLKYNEEDFFVDDPSLLNPDDLSGMQSIEDLDSQQTSWFDSLDPILLEEMRELVRRKVDEINCPTTRSVIKLTHWIPLWPEDYLFEWKLRIDIDEGDALSCPQIADIVRDGAIKTERRIHTRKWGTVNKINTIKEKWLQELGRDTYKKTQEPNWKGIGSHHTRWKIEIWPNWITNEDFEEYMRINNKKD